MPESASALMPPPEFAAPRTALEQSLERVWAEVLGLERVGIGDNFFELGGQSILAAELFARLESHHGVRLPLASLFPDSTIERQAQLIENGARVTGGSLVPVQPLGVRPPLFCVHAIDGEVLRFEPLARLLGSDQPLFGLRARGLETDSEPIRDLEAMAALYVGEMVDAGFGGPFNVCGFSSGATVAFEMARQLKERGYAVNLLALFDGDAPGWPHGRARRALRSLQMLPRDLRAYAANALRPGQRVQFLREQAQGLPTWVARHLARRPIDWDSLDAVAGLSERHVAVAYAQYEAQRRYTPRVYDGSITLFRARVRLLVGSHGPFLGWDALARGGVNVHQVGGGHAEILRPPHVRELADILKRCLASAGTRTTRPTAAAINSAVPSTQSFVRWEEEDCEQSVAARFEQQVALYPNRLAIKSETQELTYTELNRLANRIAHAILQLSPARGDQVAFLFEQQLPMIAASLGALKAGRVYVSLDPTYPRERQEFILDDAEVGIILTDADLAQQAQELADGRLVLDIGSLDPNGPADNPRLPISPDAFTYIIYTSGSTGKPKGVIENQRNVLHFTLNKTNTWSFCADDRFSLLVPYWFSASATPTFSALLNGAALLPMNIKQRGLAGLADWLEQENITIFHGSTGLFRHFARALPQDRVIRNVRVVYQGSEALFNSDVDLFKQHFADHCVMSSSLGASEMKTFSVLRIDMRTVITDRVVPVGYPVPGVELILVDEHDQPVEPGSVGEIVVRSRFIAPGYWRRPEQNARAFRLDPTRADLRRYYTGDLGWIDSDGCLHHVGRKDFQVKIRGYRVELGDVAAALLELPQVAEATVVAQQGSAEQTRLVAYVVAAAGHAPAVAELRAALEVKLPSYMLPATYVMLDALPRNANGKVDSKALPVPQN